MSQLSDSLQRLTTDLKKASATLNVKEARYLVDLYYQLQNARIRSASQIRAINQEVDEGNSHETLSFFKGQFETLENQIKNSLGVFAASHRPGRWAQSICGIGPVISAGLLAHIDITRATTAGALWKYAGICSPSVDVWNKGEKRPWNADFKTLVVFKLGECFVKVQNNDKDYYGKLFAARKKLYVEKNESGEYAQRAEVILSAKKFNKSTDAYKAYSSGKLPPAHIHAMARRIAVKMFLSHLQAVMYECHFGEEAAKPYIIDIGGHVHYEPPPNWPID